MHQCISEQREGGGRDVQTYGKERESMHNIPVLMFCRTEEWGDAQVDYFGTILIRLPFPRYCFSPAQVSGMKTEMKTRRKSQEEDMCRQQSRRRETWVTREWEAGKEFYVHRILVLTLCGSECAEKSNTILCGGIVFVPRLLLLILSSINSQKLSMSPWFSDQRSIRLHWTLWLRWWSADRVARCLASEFTLLPVVLHEYCGYWENAITRRTPSLGIEIERGKRNTRTQNVANQIRVDDQWMERQGICLASRIPRFPVTDE